MKTPGGRRARRLGLFAAVGIAAAAFVVVLVAWFRPTALPSQTQSPSVPPGASPAVAADDGLPQPDTSWVVLLVGDPASPSAREVQWIGELRRAYGRAEMLAYGAASPAALAPFRTIFVIGESPALDTTALAGAFAAGASIHLVGDAANYRAAIAGTAP